MSITFPGLHPVQCSELHNDLGRPGTRLWKVSLLFDIFTLLHTLEFFLMFQDVCGHLDGNIC